MNIQTERRGERERRGGGRGGGEERETYLGQDLIPNSDSRASEGLLSTVILRFASDSKTAIEEGTGKIDEDVYQRLPDSLFSLNKLSFSLFSLKYFSFCLNSPSPLNISFPVGIHHSLSLSPLCGCLSPEFICGFVRKESLSKR